MDCGTMLHTLGLLWLFSAVSVDDMFVLFWITLMRLLPFWGLKRW